MFAKIMALLKVALPTPLFTDAGAVSVWWLKLNPAAPDLIAALAAQFTALGFAEIALPDGGTIMLTRGEDGVFRMDEGHRTLLCYAVAESSGEVGKDGKFLEFLKQLLPIILQILPLFLKVNPPEPGI